MSGPTNPTDGGYNSDTTVSVTPSPPHATPECYLHESTNPSHQPIYTYHPPSRTHILHNHHLIPRPMDTDASVPTIHPPTAQTNPVPHHSNEAWPDKAFVHPATDFSFRPEGSEPDEKKSFVDYNIPIGMFYGPEYRQMQRWIGEGQVRNENEGVSWNWPVAEMHETGMHQEADSVYEGGKTEEAEDSSTADLADSKNGDLRPGNVCCAPGGRMDVDQLGPDAQAMKRKAEELLDSVDGRRRIGRPGKQAKPEKRQRNGGKEKDKNVVLGSGTGGLFGDGQDEEEVDEEELYNRCMAMLEE